MSVGWSGNPVIKRGARGKSRENLWSHSLFPTPHPQLPRQPSGTWAPSGASRSGEEKRSRAEPPQQPPAAGPAQSSSAQRSPPSEVPAPGRAGRAMLAGVRQGSEERRCVGTQGWGERSSSQVLAGGAAPRHGCDPVPGEGWQPSPEPILALPAVGASRGRSSLRGGAAVLHLGTAGLNLEPSRLFLRGCSPHWHCAGVFLGEVCEGLGWGSLPCIRALHPTARAAPAPKSPSFPRLPSRALAERFTFKCPLGCPRRSCSSGASPPKTERARGRRGKEKLQRFNGFLPVCRRQAGRSNALLLQVHSRLPALPGGTTVSPHFLLHQSAPCLPACSSASQVHFPENPGSAGLGAGNLLTFSQGKGSYRERAEKDHASGFFLLLETPFLFSLCLFAGCPPRIPDLCACEV